jgi:hypothetical protein
MTSNRTRPDGLIAAVPIVLLNLLAVTGQTQWAGGHLHWGWPGRLLFAAAMETIALSVTYYAHRQLIEGDSAVRLRLGAYLIAAGSATINYQEHSALWHPTPAAAVFASASLLSPVLWTSYSRFASRGIMREKGLIDRRAAKFALARWVLFPGRTFSAFRFSVWESVQSPSEAIAGSSAAKLAGTYPEAAPVTAPEAAPEPDAWQADADVIAQAVAELRMAEPPHWAEAISVSAAVERAEALGNDLSHRQLATALTAVGVSKATASNVAVARSRIRKRAESAADNVTPIRQGAHGA